MMEHCVSQVRQSLEELGPFPTAATVKLTRDWLMACIMQVRSRHCKAFHTNPRYCWDKKCPHC